MAGGRPKLSGAPDGSGVLQPGDGVFEGRVNGPDGAAFGAHAGEREFAFQDTHGVEAVERVLGIGTRKARDLVEHERFGSGNGLEDRARGWVESIEGLG